MSLRRFVDRRFLLTRREPSARCSIPGIDEHPSEPDCQWRSVGEQVGELVGELNEPGKSS
jgi:hypothetical protein